MADSTLSEAARQLNCGHAHYHARPHRSMVTAVRQFPGPDDTVYLQPPGACALLGFSLFSWRGYPLALIIRHGPEPVVEKGDAYDPAVHLAFAAFLESLG